MNAKLYFLAAITISIILASCCTHSHHAYSLKPMTDEKYIRGKINTASPNTKLRYNEIVISYEHEESFIALYEVADNVDKGDDVCFQLNSLNGVPIANEIKECSEVNPNDFYTDSLNIKTKLYLHDRTKHDGSDEAHILTHVKPGTGARVAVGNGYFLINACGNGSRIPVSLTCATQIAVNQEQLDKIMADDTKIFHIEYWPNGLVDGSVSYARVKSISKCHRHDNTTEDCVE